MPGQEEVCPSIRIATHKDIKKYLRRLWRASISIFRVEEYTMYTCIPPSTQAQSALPEAAPPLLAVKADFVKGEVPAHVLVVQRYSQSSDGIVTPPPRPRIRRR